MKIIIIAVIFGAQTLWISGARAQASASRDAKLDQAYSFLREAYQAREGNNQNLVQEKMVAALSLFREVAAEKTPQLLRATADLTLEEGPRNINLIENRNLLKIEFKTNEALQKRILEEQQTLLRQQQLILQKLALLSQENVGIKAALSTIETNSQDIPDIMSTVEDISSDTTRIADLDNRLEGIEDNTEEIPNLVDAVGDIEDNTGDIPDLADDVNDLRDSGDILDEILSIVEDIKSDTDKISDVESAVEEVKNGVDSQ